MAQAMADSSEFSEAGNEESTGFFGKFLKKHRDAKKAATEQVLAEEKEQKAALIAKMNEKIKAERAPENQLFASSDTIDKPAKKLTLSERTALKIKQQESQKQDERQAGKGIAAEMQQSLT